MSCLKEGRLLPRCSTATSSRLKKLSGDGLARYSDGQLTSAQFNQPRNFAVHLKGNIYVADKRNHAILKITTSGVNTIAGVTP
ncbi:hypothetical protein SAY87_001697 [Trapa incisa]|uniref:Uncharacterized protein n=1 Tax=Trapa incisa TaxID=236973 RepID=A0AAN7JYH2_9MYRT|nr:hypothetical protein SAY87_001697 [Trapa incisa]